MRLQSTAQSCTLVKCKPGKTYAIVLVALTCTEEVRKDRKRRVSRSAHALGRSVNANCFTEQSQILSQTLIFPLIIRGAKACLTRGNLRYQCYISSRNKTDVIPVESYAPLIVSDFFQCVSSVL